VHKTAVDNIFEVLASLTKGGARMVHLLGTIKWVVVLRISFMSFLSTVS
jgi:hypothetical protein